MRSHKISSFSLLFSIAMSLLILSSITLSSKAQINETESGNLKAFGGEYKFPDNFCLTEEKRTEIQAQIRESVDNLKAAGKLSEPSPLFMPPTFIFPVRGNAGAVNDFGVHGISNFVDHNSSFPNQLRDYNCGTRTYDTTAGYNHKGVDVFSWPFGWNKVDNNEVAITAAAAGTIIFKSDGNFDRNCAFNNSNWNAVYLQHSDGTISWYGHMKNGSLTTKTVGSAVVQGEVLGIVASSGNSTGPHLHFEIYTPTNQLHDPYQGPCNLMNNFSYWQNQPEYFDSKINKLMTHSAGPSFGTCPNPETPNKKDAFQPGEQLIVAAYYRDQFSGHVSQLSILRPDGSTYSNWSHTSPSTYAASYWFWSFTLPSNAPSGFWKFRVTYQSQTYEHTFTVGSPSKAQFDFDGDRKTDISIFRPSVGQWWYLRSSDATNRAFSFGTGTDKIVPADFTGDGKTDIATFTPSTGIWNILRSEDSSFYGFPFGTNGDFAVPADYDGDGKADSAVFRPSSATWFINKSTGGTTIQQFGANGDFPLVSDYDGDGKADLAIFRPSNGQWWILRSGSQSVVAFTFGIGSDKPVPADFTGDGKVDIAFWRQSSGEWFVLRSEDSSFYSFPYGQNGDLPVVGDYDGDGKADPAIFRNSNTTWYLLRSTSGSSAVGFGLGGDRPVPNAYVP